MSEQNGPVGQTYDIIVIGAGVVGAATARELARYDVRMLVLEAGLDLACGATRANSGIVHAGLDPIPGTLKAKYNVEGAALFPQWQRELGFGYYKNGALVLAFDEEERAMLGGLLERAQANGVKDVAIVERDELRAMEPNVSPSAVAALSAPSSGICDPYGLTFGAAENAAANGVEFLFDQRVADIERTGDNGLFHVATADGSRFTTRAIVNCAGIHADEINNMLSTHKIEISPVKGEYLLYHNELAGTFQRTVFQTPGAAGKGVLVSPVVFGNIFIGPNAAPAASKDDLATTETGLAEVLERAKRAWPEASTDRIIATYAGLRAADASGAGDFIIGEASDVPGLFNAACIDSPGLASAPAIAVDLARMAAERLGAKPRDDFNPHRTPAPLLVMMDEQGVAELISANPAYGVPVCRCCHVSEGEIVDALHRDLPVCTIDALKWRTGATMGPCHGGRCTVRIAQIIERELGAGAFALKRMQDSHLFPQDGASLSEPGIEAAQSLAAEMRKALDVQGLIEAGSGSLGIAGTRPAGVYSALETLELMAAAGHTPGKSAIVWGTHDFALRCALALDDAGVHVERVLEPSAAPAGAQELVESLANRGIPFQYGARIARISGTNRIESVAIVREEASEELATCDLLVVSPALWKE